MWGKKKGLYDGIGMFLVFIGLTLGIGGCRYLEGRNSRLIRAEEETTKQLELQLKIERLKNINE